jgi:hypothetical protein
MLGPSGLFFLPGSVLSEQDRNYKVSVLSWMIQDVLSDAAADVSILDYSQLTFLRGLSLEAKKETL